jgi:hypothetical protein
VCCLTYVVKIECSKDTIYISSLREGVCVLIHVYAPTYTATSAATGMWSGIKALLRLY